MSDPAAVPSFMPQGPALAPHQTGSLPPVTATSTGVGNTPASMRDAIAQVLTEEGFRPQLDDEGDLMVKSQGHQLYVRCLETHPPLVRVFGQWMIEDDVPGDRYIWLQAGNAVTGALNLVKAIILDDRLVVAVDIVTAPGLDIHAVLAACMDVVVQSVRTWHDTVLTLLAEQETP